MYVWLWSILVSPMAFCTVKVQVGFEKTRLKILSLSIWNQMIVLLKKSSIEMASKKVLLAWFFYFLKFFYIELATHRAKYRQARRFSLEALLG